jgi:hypothetical protein
LKDFSEPKNSRQLAPGIQASAGGIRLAPKGIDPEFTGTTELWREFALPQPGLTFSGMVWFGPKNFSLYLGNVSSEFALTTETNAADGGLFFHLKNGEAHIRISVRKEVRVGDSWVTESSE